MKRAGQILKEIGFRSEAPESLKEAFVRHLVKSATGVELEPGPNERKQNKISNAGKNLPSQLEFDFGKSVNESLETHDQAEKFSKRKSS